jgi:hypothetical protein
VAPTPTHFRAEEDFISLPEPEDTGASNMGAGSEDAGRLEPLVPPVLEKKKKTTTTSPSKTTPATFSPAKDAPAPPPAPPTKPAPAPQQTPPEGTIITA